MAKREVKMTLVSKVDLPKNETEFTYQDEEGNKICFIETNKAWVYALVSSKTSPIYNSVRIMGKVADAYIFKGVRQHDYKGGYNEAIQNIEVKL